MEQFWFSLGTRQYSFCNEQAWGEISLRDKGCNKSVKLLAAMMSFKLCGGTFSGWMDTTWKHLKDLLVTAAISSISHCRTTLECPFMFPYGGYDLPEKIIWQDFRTARNEYTRTHTLFIFTKSQTSVCQI